MIHKNSPETVLYAELPYWPSVSYLAKLTIHDRLLLENCEHFVKSANRNRCQIAAANGLLLLSIPISKGRSHKQLYRETHIDNRLQWQKQHWQSIQSAYGKSPFFEYYQDELKAIYNTEWHLLWELNEALLVWLLKKLKFEIAIEKTMVFQAQLHLSCNLNSNGFQLHVLPPYYQVFSERNGFQSDIAGLDLLCNLGPSAASQYLKQCVEGAW